MILSDGWPWPSRSLLWVLAASALVYIVVTAIYRLYFSPLAKFPGPKIAALTSWYNGYHDLVRGGQYIWVVEEMHRKYGPIVRIRPDALHVNDPDFVETLYTQSPKQRRERYWTVLQTMQASGSILGTKDHDLHRRRRAVLNPYFSLQNVRRLEPVINDTVANLLYRMEGWAKTGEPVQMNRAFRAATKDIIQAYALGDGQRCLDMEDCNADFFDVFTPQRIAHLGTYAYWLSVAMTNMPVSVIKYIAPKVSVFAKFLDGLTQEVQKIRHAKDLPEGRTIFHEIMRSDALPASEKETKRLVDEAMVLVLAGSETTASTLAALTYHLLADPALLARLKAELAATPAAAAAAAATPDALPFLHALVQETLRLYPGATHRQDRVAPDQALVCGAWTVPRGAAVGMAAPLVNRHAATYGADAGEFRPDRYLADPGLARHQFAFSRGARQCIGLHLAHRELVRITAGIFRKYGVYDPAQGEQGQPGPTLELFRTDREDVAVAADYITIAAREGSQGVRVIIRE
ncbi:cytochrome P450 [Xylariomycetidae sp. FL0641]|nr:cytochrome P450 [Xylariomycetidae sp. FL0641]